MFNSYFFKIQNKYGRILLFKDQNNVNHKISYKKLVIACGGIENSRILLLLQRDKIVENKKIGKYWMDHPIFYPAEVILNREKYSEFLFNNFKNLYQGTNFPKNKTIKNTDLGFLFNEDFKNSGINLIKTIYASSKTKNLILDLACIAPELFSKINKNIKKYCSADLHFTMEQEPVEQNQITLSNEKTDIGLPSAILKFVIQNSLKIIV